MLIAFDFDGTLSPSEMSVLLGRQRGVADEMAAITDRAMNGEIDYATSLRERAALLEGLSEAEVQAAYASVELRAGAADLLADLRDAGVHVAILTGGFLGGVESALDRAGITADTIVANCLPVADGRLSGEVTGPLVTGTKDDALGDLCRDLNIDPAETVAVGDGANDRPMLEAAGWAIGFDPKPATEPSCDDVVASMDELTALLEGADVL